MNTKGFVLVGLLVGAGFYSYLKGKSKDSHSSKDSYLKDLSNEVKKVLMVFDSGKDNLLNLDIIVEKGVSRILNQKALGKGQFRPFTALISEENDFLYNGKSGRVAIYQLESKIYES